MKYLAKSIDILPTSIEETKRNMRATVYFTKIGHQGITNAMSFYSKNFLSRVYTLRDEKMIKVCFQGIRSPLLNISEQQVFIILLLVSYITLSTWLRSGSSLNLHSYLCDVYLLSSVYGDYHSHMTLL